MRRPLIAANWKMNLELETGVKLAGELAAAAREVSDRDILVCPPFPLLSDVGRALRGSSIRLGAQNMYHQEQGAFTGEVSAGMLKSVGCSHVLLGHSERRHVFGEDDGYINKKVLSALQQGLVPVLCVGELLEQREGGKAEQVVGEQLGKGLRGVSPRSAKTLVVAYEPVWAIGTGRTATPEDADGMHRFIRTVIGRLYEQSTADEQVILYGGSVKPDNIDGLMTKENIDGVLVGGASLKADSFISITQYAKGG